MIIAAIDLGSNTLRLLVTEASLIDKNKVIFHDIAVSRLGRNLNPGQNLNYIIQAEVFAKVAKFTKQARSLGAKTIILSATQACRIAKNGISFVAYLGKKLNLDQARILTIEEEGRLASLGVLSRLKGSIEGALLADIGGCSSELVKLDTAKAPVISLGVGSLNLADNYLNNDPPTLNELTTLDTVIDQKITFFREKLVSQRLIVCGGTASSLAVLIGGLAYYDPVYIDNLYISQERLEQETKKIATLKLCDRRKIFEVDPLRADIIIAGLAIIRALLRMLNLKGITIMKTSLLEGIILDSLAK